MGVLMKPKLPKPKKIVLGPTDAAIVFRYDGARFVYPIQDSAPPQKLLDTLDYLRYALERQDWLEQWKDEQAWQDAMTDLATEEMPVPVLQVLEGGLSSEARDEDIERGPFAPTDKVDSE